MTQSRRVAKEFCSISLSQRDASPSRSPSLGPGPLVPFPLALAPLIRLFSHSSFEPLARPNGVIFCPFGRLDSLRRGGYQVACRCVRGSLLQRAFAWGLLAGCHKVVSVLEESTQMLANWMMLAQEGSAIFNLRNLILVAVLIGILVAYKIYKNKTMG